jgi:hypothetical protein
MLKIINPEYRIDFIQFILRIAAFAVPNLTNV